MAPSTEILWRGNPDLAPLLIQVELLDEDPENANVHPEASLEALRNSFQTFGQTKCLVGWRGEDVPVGRAIIIAGNGSLRAARALGWTHLAVSMFRGSLQAARAFALEDNGTARLSHWDPKKVEFQVKDICAKWDAPGVTWTPSIPARFETSRSTPFERAETVESGVSVSTPKPTRDRPPSPTAGEATIVINGKRLNERQSLFVRASIENALHELESPEFLASLGEQGPDYRDGLKAIRGLFGVSELGERTA